MDLTFAVVLAIIAVTPIALWVIWWLLADLAETATGPHSTVPHATPIRRRAA